MEQYQNTFDAIHASESLKRRMVSLMLEQNVPRACRTEQQTRRSTIPAKRKATTTVLARTDRNITAGGGVEFAAIGSSHNETSAEASASGAKGKADGVWQSKPRGAPARFA